MASLHFYPFPATKSMSMQVYPQLYQLNHTKSTWFILKSSKCAVDLPCFSTPQDQLQESSQMLGWWDSTSKIGDLMRNGHLLIASHVVLVYIHSSWLEYLPGVSGAGQIRVVSFSGLKPCLGMNPILQILLQLIGLN